MSDTHDDIIRDRVRAAAAQGTPLVIRAGGSKDFLGRRTEGETLDVSGLRGIVCYEPSELVLTARAGTPLSDIENALAERDQMLGFEPPYYGADATLGGTLACGLSGPARPFRGAARDFVLGVKMINGNGETLSFGGEVMKNVAGYDIARLMCGAYGTLGVLLEISLKVLPRPSHELGLTQELTAREALARMCDWQRLSLPLTGLCYDGVRLHLRLAGTNTAVQAARHRLGGDIEADHAKFWTALREHRTHFFADDTPLWRLSLPPTAVPSAPDGRQLVDWGGALRWLKTAEPADNVFALARAAGGHAQRIRGTDPVASPFQPLSAPLLALHRRLKQAFDPRGILNRGRMYPEF